MSARAAFYRLRQLRRIRRSLDSDSLATLIYAVVNSGMDYCNTVLAGAPGTVTDKLQRVFNAAARVITGTRKFDRGLGQILHDQMHWLDVPDRVLFLLAVTSICCSICWSTASRTPVLTRGGICVPPTVILAVPRFRLNTYGRRVFTVAGPMAWNSLPDFIRDQKGAIT